MSERGKMFYMVVTAAVGIVCVVCFVLAALLYLVINIGTFICSLFSKHKEN